MAAFFFDTSALVKRFVRETGSAWVISLLKPSNKNTVYIARITSVEVIAAITRRSNIGTLTTTDAGKSITRFERSLVSRYAFVEITSAVVSRAMALAKNIYSEVTMQSSYPQHLRQTICVSRLEHHL